MYQDLIKDYYCYGCFVKQILPLILFAHLRQPDINC
jgi:hypothetical protein